MSNLAAQMSRLAARGTPAVERAALELVSRRRAFEYLVDAAESYRQASLEEIKARLGRFVGYKGRSEVTGMPGPSFTLYVGESLPLYLHRYLPVASDRSFDAFVRRIEGVLGEAEFGFQVPNFQATSWDLFHRLLQVVSPFFRELGPRKCRFNCFFGNYRQTPFGPHLDHAHHHVFQYVVEGEKILYAWDSRELLKRFGAAFMRELYLDPLRHQARLPKRRALVAGPGDLLYWGGHYTHCLASRGPSMGISIVIEHAALDVDSLLRKHVGRTLARHPERTKSSLSLVRRPSLIDDELRRVARSTATPDLARAVLIDLLRQRSGAILEGIPKLRKTRRIRRGEVLRSTLVDQFPIHCLVHEGRLLLAVNGYGAQWHVDESTSRLRKLIAFLNVARTLRASDAVTRFSNGQAFTERDVLDVLTFLVAAGAFSIDVARTPATTRVRRRASEPARS